MSTKHRSTLRFILTNILVWLPMLVLDRLSRHVAIATTSEPLNYWGDKVIFMLHNNWNAAAFGGWLSSEIAAWLSPVAIVLCMIALLVKCKLHNVSTRSLWALTPTYLFALSNLADRLIWGVVSDPFIFTFGSDLAVCFNLADIGCIVGIVLLDISLYKDTQQAKMMYFSLEAAHG